MVCSIALNRVLTVSLPKRYSDAGSKPSGGEDGAVETAATRHSERNGTKRAKAKIAPPAKASADTPLPAVHVKEDRRTSETLTRLRGGQCEVSDCRVLISGCGRSGTHFLAEQFGNAGAIFLECDNAQTVAAERARFTAAMTGSVRWQTGCLVDDSIAATAAAAAAVAGAKRRLLAF